MTSSPERGCNRTRELLAAGVDGPLADADAAEVRRHLADCPACAAVASWVEVVDAAATRSPAPAPPPSDYFASLRHRVMEGIAASEASRGRAWGAGSGRHFVAALRRWLGPGWRMPALTGVLVVLLAVFTVRELDRPGAPTAVPGGHTLSPGGTVAPAPEAAAPEVAAPEAAAPEEDRPSPQTPRVLRVGRGAPQGEPAEAGAPSSRPQEKLPPAAKEEAEPSARVRRLLVEARQALAAPPDGDASRGGSSGARDRGGDLLRALVEAAGALAAVRPEETEAASLPSPARAAGDLAVAGPEEPEAASPSSTPEVAGLATRQLSAAPRSPAPGRAIASAERAKRAEAEAEAVPLRKRSSRAGRRQALDQANPPTGAMSGAPPPAVATTLRDSVAVFLAGRLPAVAQADLRQAIADWLRRVGREDLLAPLVPAPRE